MYDTIKGTSAIESACFLSFSLTLRFTVVVEIGLRLTASLSAKFNFLAVVRNSRKSFFAPEAISGANATVKFWASWLTFEAVAPPPALAPPDPVPFFCNVRVILLYSVNWSREETLKVILLSAGGVEFSLVPSFVLLVVPQIQQVVFVFEDSSQ